ncbi:restriction endonuclease subunit S [Thiomicrorhabdus chilensis]|uniref:restriction endonuclease subunit S n=1 Tax=Thiomicrorhabdus chilensis TaxID=63656 RepID=UPI00041B4004|nr:restriction endonuclease subunit S [Thiomicrorhabdus chilensis]
MTKQISNKKQIYKLKDVAEIKAGYPFRGKIQESPNGPARAVQPKDISELGELIEEDLICTELTGKRTADWLKRGDVILINKGWRNTATYIEQDYEDITLAPTLFLIRPKKDWASKLNMQFIAWQINQTPIQNYFKRSAEGSLQVSLRRQIIEDAVIGIPPLEEQNTLANIYENSIQQQKVLATMVRNIHNQMTVLAQNLVQTEEKQ